MESNADRDTGGREAQDVTDDRSDRREVIEGVGAPAKEKTLAEPPAAAQPDSPRGSNSELKEEGRSSSGKNGE